MIPTEKNEQLRTALLKVMDTSHSAYGLGTTALGHLIGTYGVTATADQIRVEVEYLVDKRFAAQINKPISPENRAWRITANGRDFIAQNEH